MSKVAGVLDWEARVRAKAASRAQDEADMASGRVSPAEMQARNGGGALFRRAVYGGLSPQAKALRASDAAKRDKDRS